MIAAVALAVGLLRQWRRARDLTRENRELQAETGRLEAATQARSRFLAMMSHEIRTPLTGIVGFAEALTDDPLTPDGRHAVDSIRRASSSLQELLGDILDFSRIDAGGLPIQRTATDLEALLNGIRDEFAPQARRRGLAFGLTVADEARRWSMTDPLRLRQVVVNLVSNAIRYTEAGAIRVAAAVDPDDADTVTIRVTDTGLGIAPDDCRRIFDAFSQAADGKAAQAGGGVGLGLAIAEGLVRAMGGSLTVDSALGAGSTFTVSLPLPVCAAPAAVPSPPTAAPTVAPAHILLVDDVEMNRELFAAMLMRSGHRVTTAEDGETALRCLAVDRFDLALIDIQMPFMDGIELTRRIRSSENPVVAGLPIVALSAGAYGEDRARAQEIGMDDYVTKPATREDIAAAVARVRQGTDGATATVAGPRTVPAQDPLDREAFERQRATFGDERILRFLAMLAEELERRRTAIGDTAGGSTVAELGQHAHAIASAAGNLGFLRLMDLGRTLERNVATLSPPELAVALDEFLHSIADASASIAALRIELHSPASDRRAAG
ncbi:MAG: ATP-binding protein [Thalassobaculum sp.]|uniref:ATP-binding protein n=1 Tax=Thalassobaculum sp. TaxID=2022740 RepID=UPI0032ED3F0F